ncbi:MAG TPA: DUF3304 domain-containing protein [Trinickia sp.]|nr:DUF3304 domain-containing protein [Trinickia sp.]
MPRFHKVARYLISLTAFALAPLALSACAGTPALPDDPFDGETSALTMVPVNHTDRYTLNLFVDKYWAGGVYAHAGGAAGACCYPGLKDWSKPVTVRWTWGDESAKGDKPAKAAEKRSVIVHFPAGGPKRSNNDPSKYDGESYLCVILRDIDTAELAFSVSRTGCTTK